MGSILCSQCRSRLIVSQKESRLFDQSGGPVICCPACLISWAGRKKGYKRPLGLSGIFAAEMGIADGPYSKVVGRSFRSLYEYSVAEWFHKNKVDFLYEPYTCMLDGEATLTPDFFLPDYGCFVEVKGQWLSCSRSKLKKFREMYPIPLIVVPWPVRKAFGYKESDRREGTYGGSA